MIAIGSDHIGLEYKELIIEHLREKGYETMDFGTNSSERADYPVYAKRVAVSVARGECELGILICGSGVGISICANKVRGIRAVVCSEPYSAALSRRHNNTNILAFGSRVVGAEVAKTIVDSWLEAAYEGGRHQKRLDMITDIEQGSDC